MKTTRSIPTEQDIEIVRKVTAYLYQHGHTKSKVVCDKDVSYRVKDFCIKLTDNDWFETKWYDMNTHLTERTRYELNRLVDMLKANSKELGITGVQRRGFSILFDGRKRV